MRAAWDGPRQAGAAVSLSDVGINSPHRARESKPEMARAWDGSPGRARAGPPRARGEVAVAQVPMSQLERYFFCSGVSVSIRTPIALSFMAAMRLSISTGTS